MFVVFSYNVVASEPEDTMEDFDFITTKGIFSTKDKAFSFVEKMIDKLKICLHSGDPCDPNVNFWWQKSEDNGWDVVLSTCKSEIRKVFEGENLLESLNGTVISIRKSQVDPEFDPEFD